MKIYNIYETNSWIFDIWNKDWIFSKNNLFKKSNLKEMEYFLKSIIYENKNTDLSREEVLNKLKEKYINKYYPEKLKNKVETSWNNFNENFFEEVSLKEFNDKNIEDFNNSLEIIINENDLRWAYQLKQNWKTLFKFKTEEEAISLKEDIIKELLKSIEDWEYIAIIKQWNTFYWLEDNVFTLIKLENQEEIYINNNLFKDDKVIEKYYMDLFLKEEIINLLKEKYKNDFIYLLYKKQIKFSQDSYFKEIFEAYKIILKEELKHWIYLNNPIINFWEIEACEYEWKLCIQDWTHRVLALLDILWEEEILRLLTKIKFKQVDKNFWSICKFNKEDLKVENFKNIDSIDNIRIKHILKNSINLK